MMEIGGKEIDMKKIIIVLIIVAALMCLIKPTRETVDGRFYGDIKPVDTNETYYQFRSDDNTVWWLLTEKEIGHVPNTTEAYRLTYDNNGTTVKNKPCDCELEFECECEVYDDIFIKIESYKKEAK